MVIFLTNNFDCATSQVDVDGDKKNDVEEKKDEDADMEEDNEEPPKVELSDEEKSQH